MGHVPVMSAVIVDYRPEHAAAWARLNAAWLAEGGFEIAAKDRLAIDDPQGSFLDRGGRIFIVEQNGEAVGCCALVPIADGAEVCKMTVTPAARGQGLARRLLEACEAAAREAGVKRFIHIGTEAALVHGQDLHEVDERYPLAFDSPYPYCSTKARAEQAVREAYDPAGGFTTPVLRPRFIWGPGDATLLPALPKMAQPGH